VSRPAARASVAHEAADRTVSSRSRCRQGTPGSTPPAVSRAAVVKTWAASCRAADSLVVHRRAYARTGSRCRERSSRSAAYAVAVSARSSPVSRTSDASAGTAIHSLLAVVPAGVLTYRRV